MDISNNNYNISLPSLSDIKLWPNVGLAAINSHNGGAWRVWVLAHGIDQAGAGKVAKVDLRAQMDLLGVGPRNQQRWILAAVKLGLLRDIKDKNYYLEGLARAAARLGCARIGTPVTIKAAELFKKGWRSKVWAGYLARFGEHGKRVSQATKAKLTGIEPKTQTRYQKQIKHTKIRNYAVRVNSPARLLKDRGRGTPNFPDRTNQHVISKLPDQLIISSDVARTNVKGRSRKSQARLNTLLVVGGVSKTVPVKLFHITSKGIEYAKEKLAGKNILPKDRPSEFFKFKKRCENTNLWLPMAL